VCSSDLKVITLSYTFYETDLDAESAALAEPQIFRFN
jgi:cytochrome c oxidase assembly protein Cox11